MRTNISTKFEGPNHKHCTIVFGTKGHGDLDLCFKGHLLFRSTLPISLIVLGLIIANGFLLYVKQVTTSVGRACFHPRGHNLNKGPQDNATYQILNIKGLGLALSDKKTLSFLFLFLLVLGKGCGLRLWHSLDFSLTFFPI